MSKAKTKPRKIKPEQQPYSELIRLRLIELRAKAGWSMREFREALAGAGYNNGVAPANGTCFGWEKPASDGGWAIPTDCYPYIGEIYGFKNWREWLP